MQIRGHDIGVCSWCLQAPDARSLADKVRSFGLEHVQLSLIPLMALNEEAQSNEIETLRASGLKFTAGMLNFIGEDYSSITSIRRTGGLVPDETWPSRRDFAFASIPLCQKVGLTKVSFHAGFIPSSRDPSYSKMVDRLGEFAQPFAEKGIMLLLESGQETASELLQFLNDLRVRNVQVNYDAANLILYGMGEPIEGIRTLGRHVQHVHIKDAIPNEKPGILWGQEVPFGTGRVNPSRLLKTLEEVGYTGPLVIERESAGERPADIRAAIEALSSANGAQAHG